MPSRKPRISGAHAVTERRITVTFGINTATFSGPQSVEQLIKDAVRKTEGPVTVTRVETRTVTYSDWDDEKWATKHIWESGDEK